MIAFVHGLRNWGAVEEYVAALVRGAAASAASESRCSIPTIAALAPFAELGAAGGTFDLDAPGPHPSTTARAAPAATRRSST